VARAQWVEDWYREVEKLLFGGGERRLTVSPKGVRNDVVLTHRGRRGFEYRPFRNPPSPTVKFKWWGGGGGGGDMWAVQILGDGCI